MHGNMNLKQKTRWTNFYWI